mmetsp:Transcript_81350/g.235185  ORF Transcript_81350/g.235185 Transcript_81350/m.235185 type:complete len:165 (+) Transcript_81350:109-603(+)
MWTQPPEEVKCINNSVEAFYRGTLAGGIFGFVFAPDGAGVLAKLRAPWRPALLAGSWCFFTSFASCVLTRGGFGFPWNGAVSGLFSGTILGLVARWPKDQAIQLAATSGILSMLAHYAMEGQHPKDVAAAAADVGAATVTAAPALAPPGAAEVQRPGPPRWTAE